MSPLVTRVAALEIELRRKSCGAERLEIKMLSVKSILKGEKALVPEAASLVM